MFSFINWFILFICFILLSQLFSLWMYREGFETSEENPANKEYSKKEYSAYNENDTQILAQKNAGNIEYLKERIHGIEDIKQQVDTLNVNFQSLQEQVNTIIQSQQDYATQMTGGEAPNIDGLDEEADEDTQ
jgi:hypothetical protein